MSLLMNNRQARFALGLLMSSAWMVAAEAAPSTAKAAAPQTAVTARGADPVDPAQLEFLQQAIAGTPYSALVVHTRVDVTRLGKTKPGVVGEERHTYYARVLETFRGKVATRIRYEMVVDSGEDAEVDRSPQIVTLCKGPRGFYWPGAGASVPGTSEAIAAARRAAQQASAESAIGYAHCE